ncbi:MAG: helix-turn-helix transcriptional regulator [Christensenellales bacterium]
MNVTVEYASFFDSKVLKNHGEYSPERTLGNFELELYTENCPPGYIDGKEHQRKAGTLLIAAPGNRRYSRLNFKCRCIHFSVRETETEAFLRSMPSAFIPENILPITEAFERIAALYVSKASGIAMSAAMYALFALLENECAPNKTLYRGDKSLTAAKTFMSEHMSEKITLRDIAAAAFLSRVYFWNKFTLNEGKTPLEYLTELRINRAKELITGSDKSLADIAEECGFSAQSYFNRTFRSATGCTPSEFRLKHMKKYSEQTI